MSEESLASTLEAIAKLPPANKDTLAYLILHLQRVASYSTANKIPLTNLVTVFAPTVVGNGSTKPTDADLLRDAKHQPKVSCTLYLQECIIILNICKLDKKLL